MAKRTAETDAETVDLVRGGSVVGNLLGSFGRSLKETRLTAGLGYLLSMNPTGLLPLFGFEGEVEAVRLETRQDEGRSDIEVVTSRGTGVIEAKVDATDATEQSLRYRGRWRAVLTSSSDAGVRRGVRKVRWQQLADRLTEMAPKSAPGFRFLAEQFIAHLKEHNMIKNKETWEIYAREINEPATLALFIQSHMYGCKFEKGNKLAKAQYFAPHFGASLAKEQPGIFQGISYVARVEEVLYVEGWTHFRELIWEQRGKSWWNSHSDQMDQLRRAKDWSGDMARSFLLLGEPRLVFNPPVKKESLQDGKGWLSRRFFSFDELFEAWGR